MFGLAVWCTTDSSTSARRQKQVTAVGFRDGREGSSRRPAFCGGRGSGVAEPPGECNDDVSPGRPKTRACVNQSVKKFVTAEK